MKSVESASWLSHSAAVWVASSDYIQEAIHSAESVARHMPNIKRILLSDTVQMRYKIFDNVVRVAHSDSELWYLRSTEMLSKYFFLGLWRMMVYFDTDTYMVEPIYDALDVAQCFDITGTHSPGRITGFPSVDIPDAFPEMNMGVTVFTDTFGTRRVVERWHSLYKNNPEQYKNNDQVPLREAMWEECHNGFRPYILPPEYNCRFNFGGFARYNIKVLHGRTDNYEDVASSLNATRKMRVWTKSLSVL